MFKQSGVKAVLQRVGLDCTRKKDDDGVENGHSVKVVLLFAIPVKGAHPELREELENSHYPGMKGMEQLCQAAGGSFAVLATSKHPTLKVSVHETAPEQRVGGRLKPTFCLAAAEVRGKPKLVVTAKGTTLELAIIDEIDGKLIDKVSRYLEREVWLDVFPLQEELPLAEVLPLGKEVPVPAPSDEMTAEELADLDALAEE
jgi:hypothetical protein